MRILLVVYDNESHIHWPPLGLMYVASCLRAAGHDVLVWSQDLHHWPDEYLTDYINDHQPDAVGLSFVAGYYQHAKAISLGKAICAADKKPFFAIGGHGPAPDPNYFMRVTGADAVVCGEGELIAASVFENQKPGVYRASEQADVSRLLWPAHDLFPMEYYRLMRMPNCKATDFVFPVLSGRGCPFHCNFCYRMDDGFRARDPEDIVDEVAALQMEYGITYVAFGDELLMSSEARAVKIADALAPLDIRWECCGRLNYAKPNVLRAMKRAGCVFINYGIEAVDDRVLEAIGKKLTVETITKGVEATLAAGISPGLNVLWGNHHDDRTTLRDGVDFLLKYCDGSQLRTIRPVTPYPGSPLFDDAVKAGMITDCEDFYKKHVNSDLFTVNFMGMTNREAHVELREANRRLMNEHQLRLYNANLELLDSLYLKEDATFRGFRQT